MLSGDLGLDVSRETLERLNLYLDLLRRWNSKINLVAKATLEDAVERHFNDSAQLVTLCPEFSGHWVDLGSGGGFPGLVVAILLHEIHPSTRITLIESDLRKATFLRTVLRETAVSGLVLTTRIEATGPQCADILSARALAPLPRLLDLAHRHLSGTGMALFMKGESWEKEMDAARAQWQFSCTPHKSKTNANAVVLEIGDLTHV
jgi:16S rRNA (guanine527-N7)-methyltransferase